MVYITGDTHGDWDGRMKELLSNLSRINSDITLMIAGDFGFLFHDNEQEHHRLDIMEQSGITICFCDGNHENFDALNRLPVSFWNGGKVHFLRPHVIHLMRGEHFLIDGKNFFVMGGAGSVDKNYRLLLERNGGEKCWWSEELPNNEEYKHASETLLQMQYQTDYILTHTAPTEIIRRMNFTPHQNDLELTGYLEWIFYEVQFQHWFFGHFHEDKELDCNCTCLMNRLIQIE